MLDIQFIRENPELVAKKAEEKNIKTDIPRLLELDGHRREALRVVEELRKQRNDNADKMKGGQPSPELIEEGKRIKGELAGAE